MMRVMILGDQHGDAVKLAEFVNIAARQNCHAIMQLGDFGFWPHVDWGRHFITAAMDLSSSVPIYWIDGNHENHDMIEELSINPATGFARIDAQLYYVPRGAVWYWGGKRCLALGGAYSIDKAARIDGFSWWSQETITSSDVERCLNAGKVDVMFTHDAPAGIPMIDDNPLYKNDNISRANRAALSAVVESSQPDVLYHGHFHKRMMGNLVLNSGKTMRVEGLGRENAGQDAYLIEEWS